MSQYWVFPFQEYSISTFTYFSKLALFLLWNVAYLSLFLHVSLLLDAIIIEITSQLYFTSDSRGIQRFTRGIEERFSFVCIQITSDPLLLGLLIFTFDFFFFFLLHGHCLNIRVIVSF